MVQPSIFVPKGDNIRVRLVTDYTELNKHVSRPVHLFSHTTEILQAVPKEAKFFAALDAVHGYFRLRLNQESSMITTFLLPGKFRYLRAPMGLNASSDEWCCQSYYNANKKKLTNAISSELEGFRRPK